MPEETKNKKGFSKALGFIKGILGSASVIAPVLTLFGVTIPGAAIAAVPTLLAFMNAAEDAIGDGNGPLKKQAVTESMVAFKNVMTSVSTGGQKETWESIQEETVSQAIDGIASIANAIAKQSGGEPVFDSDVFDKMKYGL